MTTKDPRRSKALAILRDGRCTVQEARTVLEGGDRPFLVRALVRTSRPGSDRVYVVEKGIADPGWVCTCADWHGGCAHVLAVKLVTGDAP